MDETSAHEGSFEKRRLSADDLKRVLTVMGGEGRRAFVEVDGDRIDGDDDISDGRLSAAQEIDVNSYWSDPSKPQWGRRHFVYLVADRSGVRYFGDSDSPEVRAVCGALRECLGGPFRAATGNATPARRGDWDDSFPSWLHPSRWPGPYRSVPATAVLAVGALLLVLVGFLIGRASVPRSDFGPLSADESFPHSDGPPTTLPFEP